MSVGLVLELLDPRLLIFLDLFPRFFNFLRNNPHKRSDLSSLYNISNTIHLFLSFFPHNKFEFLHGFKMVLQKHLNIDIFQPFFKGSQLKTAHHKSFEHFTVESHLVMYVISLRGVDFKGLKNWADEVLFFFLSELDYLHGIEHFFEIWPLLFHLWSFYLFKS